MKPTFTLDQITGAFPRNSSYNIDTVFNITRLLNLAGYPKGVMPSPQMGLDALDVLNRRRPCLLGATLEERNRNGPCAALFFTAVDLFFTAGFNAIGLPPGEAEYMIQWTTPEALERSRDNNTRMARFCEELGIPIERGPLLCTMPSWYVALWTSASADQKPMFADQLLKMGVPGLPKRLLKRLKRDCKRLKPIPTFKGGSDLRSPEYIFRLESLALQIDPQQ